jgi:hypothetical protein
MTLTIDRLYSLNQGELLQLLTELPLCAEADGIFAETDLSTSQPEIFELLCCLSPLEAIALVEQVARLLRIQMEKESPTANDGCDWSGGYFPGNALPDAS